MGFFSFKTADTKESIANVYTKKVKTVYMLQPNGEPIEESAYEGYGVFGGIDCFVWLAENNLSRRKLKDLDHETKRRLGIELFFDGKADTPLKFSFNKRADYTALPASARCEFQGYFY